ncbi:hypothetical protein MMC19_006868 [Ptychographa xylographoides]|nr:hypothetical protein [Ptychographa xylographoides]
MFVSTTIIVLVGLASISLSQASIRPEQVVLVPSPVQASAHTVDEAILVALRTYADPVDALLSLQPESAAALAEPRLLHVFGQEKPEWLTEGDKLRLRRAGKKFMDITSSGDFYSHKVDASSAGKACGSSFSDERHLPDLTHQRLIKPLFPKVSTERMHDVLKHMTSYYNRLYNGVSGEMSSEWLHDHIAQIINNSPFGTHISLEYFTHSFVQSSIIARFEPKVRNATQPLTILGAHQDSANYMFPLLPAPGADDDCSGTVSILEAFRILAEGGFIPKNGPVEFHWYAAEEAGLLGSQAIARYKKEQGAYIGAMMEFDMTAFLARNKTEEIAFISTSADDALTNWTLKLSREYISIPAEVYELMPGAGSDYMSFTLMGYPSAMATEGNPLAGDFDPYVHGVNDTMNVDDKKGFFSLDHMARFSELAIAFAIEQGGWDNTWR